MDGSYLPTYAISGSGIYDTSLPTMDGGYSTVSGKITDEGGKITVTNKKVEQERGVTEVTVSKTWEKGTEDIQPASISVTLYYDSNNNGEWDENDTEVKDQNGITATQTLKAPDWTTTWYNLSGDKNYVVKEEKVVDFIGTTDYSNSFTSKLLMHYTSCSDLNFNLAANNMLLVKLTSSKVKDLDYILWTPVDIGISDDEAYEIAASFGEASIKKEKFRYIYGETSDAYMTGVHLTSRQDGEWNLDFDTTCAWSQFWQYSYDRIINTNIVNELENRYINISVEKEWLGDPELYEDYKSVTVQLYQNDKPYGTEVNITKDQNGEWKYIFNSLPYYYFNQTTGKYEVYQYSVKETKVGSLPIENTSFKVQYTGDQESGFIITNIAPSEWFIKKVSSSDSNLPLENARFTLTLKDGDTPCYYGESVIDKDGLVSDLGRIYWWSEEKDLGDLEKVEDVIQDGTYIFEETKAPEGYQKSNVKWEIVVENLSIKSIKDLSTQEEIKPISPVTRGLIQSEIYLYKNTPLYDLPSAGGSGIFWYLISGTAFMMAASLILYRMKRKEVLGK